MDNSRGAADDKIVLAVVTAMVDSALAHGKTDVFVQARAAIAAYRDAEIERLTAERDVLQKRSTIMTDRTVYCVFVEGVYRHECVGVFSDVEKAIEAADGVAHMMEDDYHRLSVVPFALDAACASMEAARTGRFFLQYSEPTPVYGVRKGMTGARFNTASEYYDYLEKQRRR